MDLTRKDPDEASSGKTQMKLIRKELPLRSGSEPASSHQERQPIKTTPLPSLLYSLDSNHQAISGTKSRVEVNIPRNFSTNASEKTKVSCLYFKSVLVNNILN
jgi:hypothetical protein